MIYCFNVKADWVNGVVAIAIALSLTSCKGVPTKEDVQQGLSSATAATSSAFRSGMNRLKVRGSGSNEKNSAPARLTFEQYAKDEIPHTLLKKPVASGRLTSGHGYRFSPTGIPLPKKHRGVDYAAPTGTPIYAAGSGVIDKHYVSKSYGNYIRIKHANGFQTAYAHMDEFASGLSVGSEVSKGQRIGTVGSTGRSSGPHLHYELIHNGRFVDPLFALSKSEQKRFN